MTLDFTEIRLDQFPRMRIDQPTDNVTDHHDMIYQLAAGCMYTVVPAVMVEISRQTVNISTKEQA